MDSPTDTMEAKQSLTLPNDDTFQNKMTNLIGKLSRSLGFAYNPNKVYSVNWPDYTKDKLIFSKGILHAAALTADPSDSEKYTHEIIIYSDRQDKIAFSLLRTKSLEEAEDKINLFAEIFPCLLDSGGKDFYSTTIMQNVLDVATSWPSHMAAHVAVKLGLCNALKHDDVKSCLETPEEACGSYPIHIAVEAANEKVIEALLGHGISLDVTDNMGNTPMHIAATKSVSVIRALLPLYEKGKSNPFLKRSLLNKKNSLGESPLSLAAKAENLANIKMLIGLGANLNNESDVNPDFDTVNYQDNLKKLENTRDISIKDLKFGGSLLHWVKTRDAVDLAIKLGCKFDILNSNRETPLHVMVRANRPECAITLLSLRASPDVLDKDGNSPLHLAASSLSVPLLQALISFGCDVDLLNNKNESARHIASSVKADERPSNEKDKAIFVLHAVGANRCRQRLASCNQGCLLNGYSNGIPLSDEPLKRSRWVFDDVLSQQYILEAIKEQTENPLKMRGRVLCLDGGGIKGLVLCQQLAVLEKFIGRPIHECFDWVTGTSTGAFFALNLALGRSVSHTLSTYCSLKEKIFVGRRPYESGPLEGLLKEEFGEDTMMSSIKNIKVNLPTTLADRLPADLHIFRNYDAPIDILDIPQKDSFIIPLPADKQPIWLAARASGAAPTYFRLPDKFVDGGLIANNPVLDTLTEIEERNMALKSVGREDEMFHPTLVVSVGCGKHPTTQVANVDLVVPTLMDMGKSVNAAYNMMFLLVDQVCSTEERTVDRARAWCSTRKLPYFRFNPSMTQECTLDEVDDGKLVNMMWEARSYMLAQTTAMEQLKTLLMMSET